MDRAGLEKSRSSFSVSPGPSESESPSLVILFAEGITGGVSLSSGPKSSSSSDKPAPKVTESSEFELIEESESWSTKSLLFSNARSSCSSNNSPPNSGALDTGSCSSKGKFSTSGILPFSKGLLRDPRPEPSLEPPLLELPRLGLRSSRSSLLEPPPLELPRLGLRSSRSSSSLSSLNPSRCL